MNHKSFKIFIFFLLTLFCSSCAEKDKDEDGTGGSTDVRTIEIEANTDSSGRATISFLSSEVNKIAITAVSDDSSRVRFTRVQSGSTNYLTPGGRNISLANQFFRSSNTLNIPSRINDITPQPNSRFDISVEVSSEASGNSRPVLFNISSRNDNNLSSGALRMNIFYVGVVASEETSRNAVQSALNETRRIFSSSAGIDLRISEFDISGPISLPEPSNGDRLYLDASNNAPSPAVNVFIGGDIQGSSSGTILGIASGIPGPPMPSRKSAVAVSIFAAAGSNGRFSTDDIRLLGETIAHESGHQMGLFHPVDFSGSVVVGSDPLDDTEECSFFTECVNSQSLISNLMFPNPISDTSGSFIPQNRLTEQQRGVLNRYLAVE